MTRAAKSCMSCSPFVFFLLVLPVAIRALVCLCMMSQRDASACNSSCMAMTNMGKESDPQKPNTGVSQDDLTNF